MVECACCEWHYCCAFSRPRHKGASALLLLLRRRRAPCAAMLWMLLPGGTAVLWPGCLLRSSTPPPAPSSRPYAAAHAAQGSCLHCTVPVREPQPCLLLT